MIPRGYLINGNFYDENISDSKLDLVTPLYMEEPLVRKLTQDEILDIWYAMEDDSNNWTRYVEFARAILRKAQEK